MQPVTRKVVDLIEGSNAYSIPVFQRDYQWGLDKWSGLWSDVIELYTNRSYSQDKRDSRKPHFIGTMLTRGEGPLSGGLGVKYRVIDGQQRFVTLLILLSAIRDDEITRKNENSFPGLGKIEKNGHSHPLLNPNVDDKTSLQEIVDGRCLKELASKVATSNLGQAYLYFRYQLWQGERSDFLLEDKAPSAPRGKSPIHLGEFEKYWPAKSHASFEHKTLKQSILEDLYFLEIVLDESDEEDAIVFETINGKMTPLGMFDLIRNSFFLRLGIGAETYFANSWKPFEKRFDSLERAKGARGTYKEKYALDYLSSLGLEKVSARTVYSVWQKYVQKHVGISGGDPDGEHFLEFVGDDFVMLGGFYPAAWGQADSIEVGDTHSKTLPSEVRGTVEEIISISSGTTVPLHLIGLRAWQEGNLSDDELNKWFKKILGTLLRTVAADKPLNNLRAGVLQATPGLASEPSLSKLTNCLKTNLKQPTDAELKDLISSSEFATNQNAKAVACILRGIERQMSGSSAHPLPHGNASGSWTIEHIYPQNDSNPGKEWLKSLDSWNVKVQDMNKKRLTLGNVGLLVGEENSKTGQKAFNFKKEKLSDANLRVNSDVLNHDRWTSREISERGSILLSYFISEFPQD